jgi:predicted nucleic acid-binding protein
VKKSSGKDKVAMKTYWDSSALFNALASKAVFDRLDSGEHVTRSHAYAEVFSHLTGRGVPMRDGTRHKTTPADAAKMVASLAKRFSVRDLTSEETLATLELAEQRGAQGARIHDLLHARAARLAGVDLILTRDSGFNLGRGSQDRVALA